MEDITNSNTNNNIEANIPPQYKPLSMWAYFGYNILFVIPIVGLICLIVFAFNNKNLNRRNYARAVLMLGVIMCALIMGITFMVAYISSSTIVNTATYASFLNNMSYVTDAAFAKSADLRGNAYVEGRTLSYEQAYYELATGKEASSDVAIPAGDTFNYDFLEADEVCYKVSKNSDFYNTYCKDIGEYGDVYITSNGRVMVLPGMKTSLDGDTVYYVNYKDYYTK